MHQIRYTCSKTGETVFESLWSKHPNACLEKDASFKGYTGAPSAMVPLDIMADTVIEVGRWISVRAESGGTEAVSLNH